MITSDIETLEVFYAHTISPICIAVLLSVGMTVFIGCVSSWYLALAAAERRTGSIPNRFAQQGADRRNGRAIKAARLLRMPPP